MSFFMYTKIHTFIVHNYHTSHKETDEEDDRNTLLLEVLNRIYSADVI